MGLYERIRTDNKRIISTESEMVAITLYNAIGTAQSGFGRVTSPGMDINPQGQPVASRKNSVLFYISDFDSITATNETYENWKAEFIDSEGITIKGSINNPLVNKTYGHVVATLRSIKV